MLRKFRLSVAAFFVMAGLAGGVVGATIPTATASAKCSDSFLTFPAWYRGITDSSCNIQSPQEARGINGDIVKYVWVIVLNVVEIVMQIVGYLAVFYMIYGGFLYMTSNGNPDGAAKALKTIINAAVGLAIGISAIALKNLVWQVVVGSMKETTSGIIVQNASAIDVLNAALTTVYTVAGAVAIIVIVISGLNYITSSGNSNKVTKAKQSLLYAIIGLIVVVGAWAITWFILKRMT